MHDLATIQRMNREAIDNYKYNDWRDTIDLTVVRKWYLFIPGDDTPFNEIVDDYEGMRSLLHQYYVDPYDIITVPGELEE